MKLVTLMDFKYNENTMTVMKAWVYLAKRYNPSAQLIILYANFLDSRSMDELKALDGQIRFIKMLDPNNYLSAEATKGNTHPFQSTLLARYDIVHKIDLGKHIFLDWDALVLSPLDDAYSLLSDKPCITTTERRQIGWELIHEVGITKNDPRWEFSKKLFPNVGFMLYDTKSNMLTIEALMNQYKKDGRILFPVAEQGLITQLFYSEGYNWEHEKLDYTYNCTPFLSKVLRIDDIEINIRSGTLDHEIPTKYCWIRHWVGWKESRRIKVIHPFGLKKYWENPYCEELWKYCKAKVG